MSGNALNIFFFKLNNKKNGKKKVKGLQRVCKRHNFCPSASHTGKIGVGILGGTTCHMDNFSESVSGSANYGLEVYCIFLPQLFG